MNKDTLRMKPKATGNSPPAKGGRGGGGGGWEVRPGGMLVQKRNSDSNQISNNSVPTIKVKVKYGSSYHEINISSQASFGDLKKTLAGPTGLHPQDQKIMYKDKEKDSKVFLDCAGLKNGSKLVLIEDEISKVKRCIESRKNAKMEKAAEEISSIRCEVDKLAKQVASIEMDVCGGNKVMETSILNLIEVLMTQLIKLDGITADGDVKLQRRMQVRRVQKHIETLDMLKIRNSRLASYGNKVPKHQQGKIFTGQIITQNQNQDKSDKRKLGNWNQNIPGPVVVTTKWETF